MMIRSGSHVGPYQIVAPIGAGGMGEVWRARDSRIGRDIALKVLPSSYADDAERLLRFEQEAKTAGSLNHPNLVTLYELGTSDGAPYIAMELLEGETLREKLGHNAHALPYRKAIDYASQLASGLAAAHEKGIIHRDLKPENIFVTKDGRVKILDFGLAKLRIARAEEDETTQQKATNPGTVVGTPAYMSPEQVHGTIVDHRSDIFSFGAILYEMFSGRRAFSRGSSIETMNAVLHDDPPEISSSGSPPIPASVERVVRRCLEKNADERFQSASDLAFAIEAMSSSSISGERVATATAHPRRIDAPIVAAAIIVTAIVAAAAGGFIVWSVERGKTRTPFEPAFSQLTFDSGIERSPSIAPDGKTFVFVKGIKPHRRIFLQRVDGRSAIALSSSEEDDDHAPAFSPDGNQIAFRSERDGGGIFLMGATGESVRRLTSTGFDPAWSRDENEILFTSEEFEWPWSRTSVSSISAVDVATGAVRKLFAGDAIQLSISPHRKRIAYWALPPSGGQRDIYTVAINGDPKSVVKVTDDAPLDWNPQWAPDGRSIWFVSDRNGTMNLWRIAIDEASGRPLGKPEPVGVPATSIGELSLSHDGRKLLYSVRTATDEMRTGTFDPATRKMEISALPTLSGSIILRTFEPSPDGKWIAFSTGALQEDIYVIRSDGTNLRQLTNDVYRDRGVSWSPDATRIFFYSDRSGSYDAWSVRLDGSGLQRHTVSVSANFPTVSPDGRRLAFIDFKKNGMIASVDAGPRSTFDVLPRTPGGRTFWPLSWSPDGTKLLGCGWGDPRPMIYSLADHSFTNLGDRTPLIPDGSTARWIDSRHILCARRSGVAIIDLETNAVYPVAAIENVRISLNGRFIATVAHYPESDIWEMTLPDKKGE